LSQAGWLSPSWTESKGSVAEAGFTSSSGGVRAPSVNANEELGGGADQNLRQANHQEPMRGTVNAMRYTLQ
jgi:hypothetical protein